MEGGLFQSRGFTDSLGIAFVLPRGQILRGLMIKYLLNSYGTEVSTFSSPCSHTGSGRYVLEPPCIGYFPFSCT